MEIKYYGLYDTVAKTLVSTFTAANDEVCLRSCEHIASDPKSDASMLKDCVVQYLYTVDASTGTIIDVSKHDLVAMAAILDKVDYKVDDKSLNQIKEDFEKLREAFKSYKSLDEKCQKILDMFAGSLEKVDKKVDSIIKGEIKCQKYKKRK